LHRRLLRAAATGRDEARGRIRRQAQPGDCAAPTAPTPRTRSLAAIPPAVSPARRRPVRSAGGPNGRLPKKVRGRARQERKNRWLRSQIAVRKVRSGGMGAVTGDRCSRRPCLRHQRRRRENRQRDRTPYAFERGAIDSTILPRIVGSFTAGSNPSPARFPGSSASSRRSAAARGSTDPSRGQADPR